jgi:predicted nucleic acid-binding protein
MRRKERVFIDSNVMIAALLSSKGGSFHIINDLHSDFILQTSEYSIQETSKTFLKLPKKFKDEGLTTRLMLQIGLSNIRVLEDPDPNIMKRMGKYVPKNDASILGSAMISSDYLLTLDKGFFKDDILKMATRHHVRILKPRDFIELLK